MKSKKKRKEFLGLVKNIFRILGIYWQMRPWFVLAYIVVMLFIATLPFAVAYANGQLINQVVIFLGETNGIRVVIYQWLILALIAGLLLQVIYKLADWLDKLVFYDWNHKVPMDLARVISGMDLAVLESSEFRTKLARVEDGASHRSGQFVSNMFWLINDIVQIVVAIIILSKLAVWMMPLIFISLVPDFLILISGSKAHWGIWNAKESVKKRFFQAQDKLTDGDSIQEIRIFGLRSYLLNMINDLLNDFESGQKRILKKSNKLSLLSRIFESVILGGIEFWVILGVLARKWGVGDYNFYLSSINQFTNSSRNFLRNINNLYENNLYLNDYFDLMDMKNKIVNKENAVKVSDVKPPRIEFKNVSFTYPGSKDEVFDGFNMVIEPGEDIALVGENGAGKTTLVKLLSRFYDVDEGQILIDGIDIRDIDLDSWYRNLGILFQKFNTYGFSAYENIALGNVNNFDDKEGVKEASKQAGAHDFILKQKKKYKQILSKWFSDGTDLSGGQWQRIGLARAFFRKANVLILDEPTSAIDAKGEYEIFEKIAKYQKSKTTIIISHRFSTVRKADKIYVIDKGKILEKGTHEELMLKHKGKYKKMFELQAAGYK